MIIVHVPIDNGVGRGELKKRGRRYFSLMERSAQCFPYPYPHPSVLDTLQKALGSP